MACGFDDVSDEDLDRWVAREVMGWDVDYVFPDDAEGVAALGLRGVVHFRDPVDEMVYLPSQWTPSGRIEQAWLVANHVMRLDSYAFDVFIHQIESECGRHRASAVCWLFECPGAARLICEAAIRASRALAYVRQHHLAHVGPPAALDGA